MVLLAFDVSYGLEVLSRNLKEKMGERKWQKNYDSELHDFSCSDLFCVNGTNTYYIGIYHVMRPVSLRVSNSPLKVPHTLLYRDGSLNW